MLTNIIGQTAFWSFAIIALLPTARRPRQLICDCKALVNTHVIGRMLALKATCVTIWIVCLVIDLHGNPVTVFLWILPLLDWLVWWKHEKNSRKKLGEKVLGVVRAWAGGLRVVPVAHGA